MGHAECESEPTDRKKVAILGGGPNRIGQGIEFDYCCCHAAFALEAQGYETIMVNCNPETVSTDYDTSDRLYFEPMTDEDVVEVLLKEQEKGTLHGAIVQFGGQTPLKLAPALEKAGIPILGTSPDAIDLAEDRDRFKKLLQNLGLKQPVNDTAMTHEEARAKAALIGYPVVLRPSNVLGGRAMEIVRDEAHLDRFIDEAMKVSDGKALLLDSYLSGAVEVDVDAICDGEDVFVAGIMEHIEQAGIHSGDSACSLPPHTLDDATIGELTRQTELLANGLKVRGLMNVQFAIQGEDIFILEVNPRASRTVPFVAKAIGQPIAKFAARVMAGEKLSDLPYSRAKIDHVAVKEAVFPFARFEGVDTLLGPEMRSTGEVMGLDRGFNRAFLKSQIAASATPPTEGTAFISVRDADKAAIVEAAQKLSESGFAIVATGGTADYLADKGIALKRVNKVYEGRPHIVDLIKDGGIQMVINTTEGAQAIQDSFEIRATALKLKISYYTTAAGALAASRAVESLRVGSLEVTPLQDYF